MKRLCLALLAGCSSAPPVNAAGNYSVSVTNRDNGCNLANWTVGQMSTGIPVTITQTGGNATAVVGGGAQIVLDLVIGGHAFTGTVEGNGLDLTLQGTIAKSSGNCTYTTDGEILATLSGDLLTGRINYTAATNGHTDCASLMGCVTYQDFNGTRPPL